jgi:hypothetical protein
VPVADVPLVLVMLPVVSDHANEVGLHVHGVRLLIQVEVLQEVEQDGLNGIVYGFM